MFVTASDFILCVDGGEVLMYVICVYTASVYIEQQVKKVICFVFKENQFIVFLYVFSLKPNAKKKTTREKSILNSMVRS